MKGYNHGEYYELGERLLLNGETVEVVEDEGEPSCAGCRLKELIDVPCSLYCSWCERMDDKSVMFKLVEEAKKEVPMSAEYPEYDPSKEYAVYEHFQYNGVVAECTPSKSAVDCRACVLNPCNGASVKTCKCMESTRKDGVSVYYKRLNDVRP